jgi:hypothetical protein
MDDSLSRQQHEVCQKFGAPFFGCDLNLKVGISRNVKNGEWPIHALRSKPEHGTSGWYIWAGEYSDAPDFFVPLHGVHLEQWAPLVLPYLALGPGWRFLLAPDCEDVWEDLELKQRSS